MSKKKSGIVLLFGNTNVGKSTLLNAIVNKMVSIVTYKPQTTRNIIRGIYTEERGQIVFIDTPGLHKPKGKLGKKMVSMAFESLKGVDLILIVIDCTTPIEFEKRVVDAVNETKTPKIVILNKIDRLKEKSELLPMIEKLSKIFFDCEIIPISALCPNDVEKIKDKLFELLDEGEPLYDEELFTDQMEKNIAAEIIRKNLFLALKKEIPYSTTVYVEEFKEPDNKNMKLFISAVIVVEKSSHKPIVIGKGGKAIKELGIKSRQELEEFFGLKVDLRLFVKVKPDWENDPTFLKEIGIR